MIQTLLTTVDNPWDPFDEWDKWYAFDEEHEYHSCSLIARLGKFSDDLSDSVNQSELDQVLSDIMRINVHGMFKLVSRNVEPAYATAADYS